MVLSLALQHGAPIETIRHAVTRCSDGSPASILGAVVDRISAIHFLGRYTMTNPMNDSRFFERHPERKHRVRYATRAEIEQLEIAGNKPLTLPQDFRMYVFVRSITSDHLPTKPPAGLNSAVCCRHQDRATPRGRMMPGWNRLEDAPCGAVI